jgi:rSAM/selenodomain-associated transferase 1
LNDLVLFVKNPEPGKVKTRLTALLSSDQAAALYRAFILDTLILAGRVPDIRQSIAYAPPDGLDALRRLIPDPDMRWFPQTGSSLGERLLRACRLCFEQGAQNVVIMGSDSPILPPEYLTRAFDLLQETSVVLGPASDGGYYLIGLSAGKDMPTRCEALFSNIAWSTGTVYRQTVEAARQAKMSLTSLPPWSDVDEPDDIQVLSDALERLRASGENELGRHTEQVLRTLRLRMEAG